MEEEVFLDPLCKFWVSAVKLEHPFGKIHNALLEELGAPMVKTSVEVSGSLRALAAVGAPVIEYVLDTCKIPLGHADSNALLQQPKLVHIGL